MATYGDTTKGQLAKPEAGKINGSFTSDWQRANTDLTTATAAVLLDPSASGTFSTVLPVSIPEGATRVLVRIAVGTDADTFTTDPKIILVVTDGSGYPIRVDSPTDADASGVTLEIDGSSTNWTSDSKYWSDVPDAAGYDLLGCGGTLYVFPKTTGSYLDGATPQAIEAYVKFIN